MAIEQKQIVWADLEGIDHPKFLVVAAIAGNRNDIAVIIINSAINPRKFPSKELKDLHYKISPDDYPFLDHDSWVDCSQIIELDFSDADKLLTDHPECGKGKISNTDFSNIFALLGSENNDIKPKIKRKYGF
jgi:hypothetical protein